MILRLLLVYPIALARAASERAWLAVQPLSPGTEHDDVQCCDHDCTIDVDHPIPYTPAARLDLLLWEREMS